jgi:hypothetical protein
MCEKERLRQAENVEKKEKEDVRMGESQNDNGPRYTNEREDITRTKKVFETEEGGMAMREMVI